jgi:hypothetical protein
MSDSMTNQLQATLSKKRPAEKPGFSSALENPLAVARLNPTLGPHAQPCAERVPSDRSAVAQRRKSFFIVFFVFFCVFVIGYFAGLPFVVANSFVPIHRKSNANRTHFAPVSTQ